MKRGLQLKFSCGDRVREIDGCHEGLVIAQWGWIVRVLWDLTYWKQDLSPDELELVERVES
jgi:hypothetical protein